MSVQTGKNIKMIFTLGEIGATYHRTDRTFCDTKQRYPGHVNSEKTKEKTCLLCVLDPT